MNIQDEAIELLHQVEEDLAWLAASNAPNSKIGKATQPIIERVVAFLDKIEPDRAAARKL